MTSSPLEKFDLLFALNKLRSEGFELSREFTMKDTEEDMTNELNLLALQQTTSDEKPTNNYGLHTAMLLLQGYVFFVTFYPALVSALSGHCN